MNNKWSIGALHQGRRAARLLSTVFAFGLSCPGWAQTQATYTCSGVPKGVSIDLNRQLVVGQIGGLTWGRLCSVDGVLNGVTTSACKATYAGLLAAQATGRPAMLWIANAAGSCAANPQWNWVAGFYFMSVDP